MSGTVDRGAHFASVGRDSLLEAVGELDDTRAIPEEASKQRGRGRLRNLDSASCVGVFARLLVFVLRFEHLAQTSRSIFAYPTPQPQHEMRDGRRMLACCMPQLLHHMACDRKRQGVGMRD